MPIGFPFDLCQMGSYASAAWRAAACLCPAGSHFSYSPFHSPSCSQLTKTVTEIETEIVTVTSHLTCINLYQCLRRRDAQAASSGGSRSCVMDHGGAPCLLVTKGHNPNGPYDGRWKK